MSVLPKILVVDDDPVVAKSFDRVLSQQGYVVVTASSGEEALGKLKEGEYDVVFTDIKMPGMDGIELAEHVKARRSWTPVVIVTGYGSKANEDRARAVGVSAFLQKPLSPEQIEASARSAMAAPAPALAAPAWGLPAAPAAVTVEPSRVKLLAAAAAAPFKGLAYILALPFFGLAMLAMLATKGARALGEKIGLTGVARLFRNALMLAAAPFIGLAYAIAMPFVGLGVLLIMAAKALARSAETNAAARIVRNTGLIVAAPFIGLAYLIAMPIAGLGALLWVGISALGRKVPRIA